MKEGDAEIDSLPGDPSTGTTDLTYYQDGTQDSETDPGQGADVNNTPDPQAGQAETTTLPDGNTQTETLDDQGNLISQSGDGQLAATYGYDENGTGQMTALTTSTGTTRWAYDPDSGDLQSETFADGTRDVYSYNDKDQLSSEILPGVTGTFGYDAAGDQLRSTYIDSTTGLVQSIVAQQDDQGRAIATVDTDNGKTFTETDAYTSLGDLQSETFGSAGNTTVAYGYYASNTAAGYHGGDADALASITASTPGGQSVSQAYTYDSTGRLASITVNGIVLNYSYVNDSNQVAEISAEPVGANVNGAFVNETFTPDSADGSRLASIEVDAGNVNGEGAVYDAGYTYNNDNQRETDQITETDATGNTTSQTLDYTYSPSEADALTKVTDGSGNVLFNYGYDATGNFTGNASLGSVNSVNEYSDLTYNARHDLTNDGTYTYGYDALDRLISVTPNSPSTGSLSAQYGYDSQGRMTWEDVYTYSGSAWTPSASYAYVWNGSELIAKLDGNNNVLQQYTWGPGENGTDEVLALTDYTAGTAHTYVLAYDASGNVAMMIDPSDGNVVANYTYTPYGALVSATGPQASINPWAEKGYFTDAAVDPNLAWAGPATGYATDRVVDPVLAVWLQPDPSGVNGGDNSTEYLADEPIDNVDPNGTAAVAVQWHHLLPQAVFTPERLNSIGLSGKLDIHVARYGWLLDPDSHVGVEGVHALGWNQDWQDWITVQRQSGASITIESIEVHLKEMMDSDKYSKFFQLKRGGPAPMSYKQWTRSAGQQKMQMFEAALESEGLSPWERVSASGVALTLIMGSVSALDDFSDPDSYAYQWQLHAYRDLLAVAAGRPVTEHLDHGQLYDNAFHELQMVAGQAGSVPAIELPDKFSRLAHIVETAIHRSVSGSSSAAPPVSKK